MGVLLKNMQTPKTALLVRPRPILDESLSSWRQRVAWANCYRLYPVSDERTRRADPDIGENDDEVNFIAHLHQSTKEILKNMTLKGLEGCLTTRLKSRSHPAWWLSAGYGLQDQGYGSMFCPLCLGADEVPYFRLNWRLGFIADCKVHRIRLLDHCKVCHRPPWPAGCGSRGRVHRGFTTFRFCWHCGEDYSGAKTEVSQSDFDFETWLSRDSISFGSQLTVAFQAYVALRTVCRLFLRGSGRRAISNSKWNEVVLQLSPETNAQHFERLSVSDRSILLMTANKILRNWPTSFISFTKETGITKRHFDGMHETLPDWFTKVIESDVAIKKTTVTEAILVSKVEELTDALGRKPTKTELRKALNWQGERGMEKVFPKRLVATGVEWQHFVSAIEQLDLDVLNSRERRALLSNLTVILVCLIENIDVYKINATTKQEWVDHLLKAPIHQITHCDSFCNLIESLRPRLEELLRPKVIWLMQSRVNRRDTTERLRSLMSTLPKELVRDVNVFKKCIKLKIISDFVAIALS